MSNASWRACKMSKMTSPRLFSKKEQKIRGQKFEPSTI